MCEVRKRLGEVSRQTVDALYCDAHPESCVPYQLASQGLVVPANLLPNGIRARPRRQRSSTTVRAERKVVLANLPLNKES